MECPNCKRFNLQGSLQCKCGYAFLTGTISAPSIRAEPQGSMGRGVGLGLLSHLLQIVIVPGATFLFGAFSTIQEPLVAGFFYSIRYWSLTQFLYLGPAAWLAFRRGQLETAKGFLIVGAIGVLINGACDAMMFRA
jgi:hypothetical protein